MVGLRAQFLDVLRGHDPVLHALYGKISNYNYIFLFKLVSSRKAVQQFAKYIYLTLRSFDETPRYFPVAFRILG